MLSVFIVLLLIVHCSLSNNNNTGHIGGDIHIYDTTRNGWYIGGLSSNQQNHNPIIVNLRQHYYPGVPERYHNFLNQTLSRQPKGVCQKEIPITSLLEPGQYIPRGNGSNPTLSRITVCCQGYQHDPHIIRKCNPICHSDCVNGICFKPNECICYPEHVKNLAGICVPTCPIGCDNGDCNGNECVCKSGFTLDKLGKFCVPICNPPCGRGNCIAPNKCACNVGYEMNDHGVCIPKCTNGCDYGECVAPEKCACRPGYILQYKNCKPICEKGCINGFCTAPNHCSCPDKMKIDKSGTKCEPKCDPPCLNGKCVRPNECVCNPGYEADPNDWHRCNPHCTEPCVNGVCSAPGLCLCNVGFVKDRSVKNSQICVPKQ